MRWRCQHLERVKEVISGTQVADLDEPDRDLLHSTAAAAALAPAKEGRFLLPGEGGRTMIQCAVAAFEAAAAGGREA